MANNILTSAVCVSFGIGCGAVRPCDSESDSEHKKNPALRPSLCVSHTALDVAACAIVRLLLLGLIDLAQSYDQATNRNPN